EAIEWASARSTPRWPPRAVLLRAAERGLRDAADTAHRFVMQPLAVPAFVVVGEANEGDTEANQGAEDEDQSARRQSRRPIQRIRAHGVRVGFMPALVAQARTDGGEAQANHGAGGNDASTDCSHRRLSGVGFTN